MSFVRKEPEAKTVLRIARFLEGAVGRIEASASPGKSLLVTENRGTISVQDDDLSFMQRSGIICVDHDRVQLAEPGRAFLRRREAPNPAGFQNQHRHLEARAIDLAGHETIAVVNLAESPLGNLARRKDRNGNPFLDEPEIRAGERLRSDYTRGQLMPRLGANWIASVSSGKRSGSNGATDLTDAALAARQRVNQAIDEVGPELAGILIDVCCFLKGLEQVEIERGWPVSSAKIVPKTALAALARHYEPMRKPMRAKGAGLVHWGADDFRPTMAG